jgi:inner membrane protein
MDNITHSLVGVAMARAGLNRFSPRATLLLVLAANAPDMDVLAAPRGALPYLEAHRGYTHSLVGLPIMAALTVLVTVVLGRKRLPWVRVWLLACLGLASHLLIDCLNSYGVRLLLPFSSRWFHLDLNNLYDFVIWAVLGLAVIWPSFSALVSKEIGATASRGRNIALAALIFFALFSAGRALMHHNALQQLSSRLYDGAAPLSIAAMPDAANPFHWTGIVETENSLRELDVEAFGDLNLQSARLFYKRPLNGAIAAALPTEAFRFFRYFARFPVWSEEPVTTVHGDATRIELTDLRFGVPGAGAFHCIALVTSSGQVLESRFTYASGTELGRDTRNAKIE